MSDPGKERGGAGRAGRGVALGAPRPTWERDDRSSSQLTGPAALAPSSVWRSRWSAAPLSLLWVSNSFKKSS